MSFASAKKVQGVSLEAHIDPSIEWTTLPSNDVHQISGLNAPKSSPRIASAFSVELVQVMFALFDAFIIFFAAIVACGSFTPFSILISAVGTVLFVLGKALMRGYSRQSLA